MNRKALFFDIDGTLWDYHNNIPESTVTAIRAARANGHAAFICTGRSRSYVRDKNLLGIGFDGIVSSCGAMIEYEGKTLFYKALSPEILEKGILSCRKHGMRLILEGRDHHYMDEEEFGNDDYGRKVKQELGDCLLTIKDNWGKWDAQKFSCAIDDGDPQGFMDEMSGDLDFIVHGEPVIEVIPKGFSKGTGLVHTCSLIGVDVKDSFAFGDSANDFAMFEVAGTAVAMGDGDPRAKAMADYVTTPLHEDGIYNALLHFGLI